VCVRACHLLESVGTQCCITAGVVQARDARRLCVDDNSCHLLTLL